MSRLKMKKISLSKYPNPANKHLQLEVSSLQPQQLDYLIRSASGSLIKRGNINSSIQKSVNLSLPTGIYFIEITNNKGTNKTGKILVR